MSSVDPKELRELLWIARGGLDPVSLEKLREAGQEPEDVEDVRQRAHLRAGMLHWLTSLSFDELSRKFADLDPETLELVREIIDEVADDAVKDTGKQKLMAAYLKVAAKEGREFVKISDYLHIMDLRAVHPNVSTRALARMLKKSETTIRRWDKRAKELGVTREDWDLERIKQIVKPSRRRAPP